MDRSKKRMMRAEKLVVLLKDEGVRNFNSYKKLFEIIQHRLLCMCKR